MMISIGQRIFLESIKI